MFIHLVFSSIVCQTPFNITPCKGTDLWEGGRGLLQKLYHPINVIWCCPHTMPLVTEVTIYCHTGCTCFPCPSAVPQMPWHWVTLEFSECSRNRKKTGKNIETRSWLCTNHNQVLNQIIPSKPLRCTSGCISHLSQRRKAFKTKHSAGSFSTSNFISLSISH